MFLRGMILRLLLRLLIILFICQHSLAHLPSSVVLVLEQQVLEIFSRSEAALAHA